jgi:hybrid cluster-associated redox disulfide protein
MVVTSAKITKNMTFLEMLKTYPETAKVLKKYNLACASCMGAQSEPIDLGAINHGLDPEQLLADLNAAAK